MTLSLKKLLQKRNPPNDRLYLVLAIGLFGERNKINVLQVFPNFGENLLAQKGEQQNQGFSDEVAKRYPIASRQRRIRV